MSQYDDQQKFVSDAFTEEQYNEPAQWPSQPVAEPHKRWALQVKIWSIVLLVIGIIHLPLILLGRTTKIDSAGEVHLEIFLGFRWENLLSALFLIPTGIFGIIGGFREKLWALKIYMIGLCFVVGGYFVQFLQGIIETFFIGENFWIWYHLLITIIICMVAFLGCFTLPCGLCGFCSYKLHKSLVREETSHLEEQYGNLEDDHGDLSQLEQI
jgi:hypothetical protein